MSEYRLVMKGVVKTFPGVKALDHAQLELRPGKVMALMGENGAGKSTLMKCMFGIYKMDEGEIEYEGEKVTIPTPLDALNRGIAMVHQELQPIPARTVAENIDAQYRTEFSIKALTDAGKEVECLYEYLDNWDQTTAQQDVANALSQYGDKIEGVFCNNDAMALGALQSIQQAGRTVGKDIYLVGVDALTEAVQDVLDGNMTGTVLNDDVGQATAAAEATKLYVEGSKVEQYYWVDYVKVTKDNASEYVK